MVPKGWDVQTINDIALVSSGGTPSRSKAEYWGGEIPWATTAEIQCDTILDTAEKITQSGLENSSAKLFPSGTILMAMYGQGKTRGKVAKLGIESTTNQACAAIQLKKNYLVDFYFQFLQSQYENIRKLSNSGSQENLNAALVKSIRVPVPPFLEQKKITKILSTWDQSIATTEKLLANSHRQKKALMQFLLTGKQRLNGFSGIQWKEYRLGKLFNERIENNQLDLPLVSITREQGVIWRDDVGRKDTSSEDKTKYLRICPGDIGYNTMRMWQGVSALSDIEGLVSPAYTVITPKYGVDGVFMSYLFKLPRTIHNFYRYSQGLTSDTWNLKFRHFKEITVTIPELEEQKRISKIHQKCDEEIAGLIAMREALVSEKKVLMQSLLTGKRRVKVDES